jgi:hypothetical protein
MQTETTATEATTETAQTVDTTAATTTAPASAAAATTATDEGTSTTTETEGDSGTQQETEQERNDKGQFKSGAQKRIDALVYQRHQAEREAAYWKQQAQAVQSGSAEPRLTDFETHDEYDQAMLQHRIDQGVNRGLSKTAEQQATKFEQQAQSAAAETYNQRVTEAVTRIPDFVEVVSKSDVPMSPALHEALMDSERGPELVYHLAKNPAEAVRLNNMSVRQMDREIGRLESSFGTKPAAPTPPAARTTSAPAPIKPGSPASAPANTDPNKMDQAQFEAWAKANGSKYIR